MGGYFKRIYQSIFNPYSYREVIGQSFGTAFIYNLVSYLVISLVITAWFSIFFLPKLVVDSKNILASLKDNFPVNLALNLTPTALIVPPGTEEIAIPLHQPLHLHPVDNVLVINPSATAEQVVDKNTLLLATSKAIAIATANRIPRVIPYQDINLNAAITKDSLTPQLIRAINQIDRIKLALPVIIFFSFLAGLLVIRTLTAVIYAVLFVLVGKLYGKAYAFGDFLKINLYTTVIADLVLLLLFLLYRQYFPTFYSLAFFGFSFIAMLALPKK